jgi:hypothetical protein
MAGLKPSSELISVMQEILKENPASASSIPITPSLSSSSPSLFSSEEISLLQSDFDQSYVTSLSLKLIKRYLTRDQKKRTLRSLLQGSSLKFPKFVIPTVEVSTKSHPVCALTTNNLKRIPWKKRKEESIYKEDNKQKIIIS